MNVPARAIGRAATSTAALASALTYPFLPKRVATHFDLDGRPDRYSTRLAAALGLPVTMVALILANDRLGSWPGGRDREDVASGVQVRDEAIGLLECALLPAQLTILANGVGLPLDTSRVSRGVFGLLMIGLGNLMPKLPRNGLIGIRTPWTLADPTVWERTHRLGGYLVMASGFASVASLPATGKRATRLPLAALLSAVGLSNIYSFILYRRGARSGR